MGEQDFPPPRSGGGSLGRQNASAQKETRTPRYVMIVVVVAAVAAAAAAAVAVVDAVAVAVAVAVVVVVECYCFFIIIIVGGSLARRRPKLLPLSAIIGVFSTDQIP